MHDMTSPVGVAAFWAQADSVGKLVALLLLAMSVATWYLVLTKLWQGIAARRQSARAEEAFFAAESLRDALAAVRKRAPGSALTALAQAAADAAAHHARHVAGRREAAALDLAGLATLAMRKAVGRSQQRVEAGLTVLGSIGATAPFIGLFGTVWGIYNALIGIGFTGQATIDKVAGPVGEALIMTAFGLAVAIPAVLAYNVCVRANRSALARLQAFASDLHAYLLTGAPMRSSEPADTRPSAATGVVVRDLAAESA
jgi:biopolymer transport protein ExbB